jgi:hypothetical protein
MSFAAFLVAFAIAAGGNPSSVSCQPDPLPVAGAYGYTWFAERRIEIAPNVCAGLLLLSATADERARIHDANRWLAPAGWMGLGALVLAHEAQHTVGVTDEGEAECRAVNLAPQLLEHYLSGIELGQAQAAVTSFHDAAAAQYRTVC